MPRIIQIFMVLLTGLMMSFYFHPVLLVAYPVYNTKIMLAILGAVVLVYRTIRTRDYSFSKGLLSALMIAGLFSLVCLVSVVIVNETEDYSYASYPMSAIGWIMGAYGAINFIRWTHQKVTIELVVRYLAGGGAFHSIFSQVMDRNEGVKSFINSIFFVSSDLDEAGRLYSFGVGLDPAGVRFAVILVMIAGVLTISKEVRKSTRLIIFYISCFVIISILGNIISRTTTVGMGLGLFIFAISTGLYKFVLKVGKLKIIRVLGVALALGVPGTIYYYNANTSFREQVEYGFEGFFSMAESGEFQTGSTDVLATMWIWPEDTQTWIIGSGKIGSRALDNYDYFTDIGYCRFVFYSGLIGLMLFSIYFIYNGIHFSRYYPRYKYIFLLLIAVTFIVWIKVATDIFQLYALFYAFTDEEELYASDEDEAPDELESKEKSNPALIPQA